jgi:hypothetical protein
LTLLLLCLTLRGRKAVDKLGRDFYTIGYTFDMPEFFFQRFGFVDGIDTDIT